jgi:hypothetical protein
VAAGARGVKRVAKKQQTFANPSQNYLFNFASIGVGISTVLLAIFGMKGKDIAPPCSERFGIATQFSLQSSGQPATATELQAGLGGRDWGVIENASVVKTPGGPRTMALQVNLPKSSGAPGGLSFTWLQTRTEPAVAACLSYQVRLPADLEFGQGALLPGLFGGETDAAPKAGADRVATSFGTHLAWNGDGRLSVRIATADPNPGWLSLGKVPLQIERGRWVSVEQEVVLNHVGAANGILRVWIDGKMQLEHEALPWRVSDSARFQGVDVRAHYVRGDLIPSISPKPSAIQLSPFELSWQ